MTPSNLKSRRPVTVTDFELLVIVLMVVDIITSLQNR